MLGKILMTILAFGCLGAASGPPNLDEVLGKYDGIMGPDTFEAQMTMVAHREDGTEKSYAMRSIKKGTEQFRIWFEKPASVAGQEMLRLGDNSWVYLPNLKRATRIANRDSFQGGDFNNADVLRVNYKVDYSGEVKPGDGDTWLLELKAKNPNTSYDAVKLWVRRSDFQPVTGEYYGTSGKLLRSAAFSEYREFQKGYTRPSRVLMQNELIKARHSEMTITEMKVGGEIADSRFNLNDLGK